MANGIWTMVLAINHEPSAISHFASFVMRHPTVGVGGLGIMGSAIAANLMQAGHRVVGYDILARRRQDHRRAGGQVAKDARDLGTRVDIVVCSLPSSDALRQAAVALAKSPRPPQIVIETSTLPIAVKQQARDTLRRLGTTLIDCPLSG